LHHEVREGQFGYQTVLARNVLDCNRSLERGLRRLRSCWLRWFLQAKRIMIRIQLECYDQVHDRVVLDA
jgi:hypothetical protein